MVVLARSIKCGGWCVAGKELTMNNGVYQRHGWIRPVTQNDEAHGALMARDCIFSNGQSADILDIVEFDFIRADIEPGQPENLILRDNRFWRKIRKTPPRFQGHLEDRPRDLWLEPGEQVDRISPDYAAGMNSSLALIRPVQFHITLSTEYDGFSDCFRHRYWADFQYNGVHYNRLSVTDPRVRNMLNHQFPKAGDSPNRVRLLKEDDYFLCISVGPEFGQSHHHYKFVATVLDFDGYLQSHY